jgi:hypothetical protein
MYWGASITWPASSISRGYDEAEPLYRKALQGRREVLGRRHPQTLIGANNLAFLYQYQGHLREAEPLFPSLSKDPTSRRCVTPGLTRFAPGSSAQERACREVGMA